MRIIVYTKTGCPWCKEVLDLLARKNIRFEERNVTENKEFSSEMVQKSSQTKTPTLDIDGEILADTDADEVAKHFRAKGVSGF